MTGYWSLGFVAVLALFGCGDGRTGGHASAGPRRGKAATDFQVPREWFETAGFEASPLNSDEPYLVYQSKDFQNLLILPTGSDSVWVLALVDRAVYSIPRGRVSITGGGADVTSAPAARHGSFVRKTATDIIFPAGADTIRLSPYKPLVGEVPLATLLQKKREYAESAGEYTPDSLSVHIFRDVKTPVEMMIFFGTWCSTCRRNLPDLIRALEDADNPSLNARFIACDENLTNPLDLIKKFDVQTTPTVVVLEGGREIGRVTGHPKSTLERDVARVIAARWKKG